MLAKLFLQDLDLNNKKVLIRVDFNVPIENGYITDDKRIVESLPTISYVLEHGGIPILMSHLGRPQKKEKQFSLAPCAARLSELLNKPVKMASDCCGAEVEKTVRKLQQGDILMLENLRFHAGEKNPTQEPVFVSSLARLGDIYINDAFGSAHRTHASVVAITQFFPERAAAGLLLQKEIKYLGSTILEPQRPFYAILGGAKISTKFRVLESLTKKADVLLIGGAMANTFLKSEERKIGDSFYEKEFLNVARELLDISSNPYCRIMLPVDLVVADRINAKATVKIVSVKEGVPKGFQALDIGPRTIDLYAKELKKASTVFWNGPLGVFECSPFANGTHAIAQVIAQLKATTIVGGGDSLAAIEQTGLGQKVSHLSTGGGATLEFIEKRGDLPGIEALSNKESVLALK